MNQAPHGYGLLCLLVAAAPLAAQQPQNTGPVRLAAAAAEGPAVGAAAPAAEESPENVETVTVTGIRAAIESAIAVKQESNSIVEAISAEDIGKLPDTSIAESISRLPGLTSQRSDGRASDISIRGTGPDLSTTLLNGREQVSTGDNRSIEYDQYPSELVSGVIIYKTPDATLVGQGLAGTIALQTTRPLEYGRRAIVLNIRGEKNSDAKLGSDSTNHGYRASFSYIDQYLDNTLGLTIGYARLDSPIVGKEFGMYDPWKTNRDPTSGNLEHSTLPPNTWISDGIKSLASSGDNRRDGALATLEWKPNTALTSTLDVFYTKNTLDNDRRSVEANLGNYPGQNVFSNPIYAGDTLVGATVSGLVPLARNFSYLTKDQIIQAGWNNKWVADDWSIMGDVAYSRATRDEHDYETQGQYQDKTTDTATFYLPESSQPTFRLQNPYNNPAQVLVGPTIYGAGYSRFPHVIDELKSVRLEGSHAIGHWFSDVVVGVNYDDRKKDKRQPEANLNTIGNLSYQVPANLLLPAANLGFSGTPGSLAWSVPGVLAQFFQPVMPTTDAGYLVGKTWKVFEKLTTVYVKGDLDQQLTDSIKLRGNIGVQVVHTDQSSSSRLFNDATQTATPLSDGKTFNDVLPAANLVLELPAEQALRFGVAKEVARARMDELAASSEFSIGTTGIPASTVGNPKLDPWRATAVDLSYEKYFAKKAYVSASLFYKDLKTYIYKQTIDGVDYTQIVNGIPPGTYTYPILPAGFKTIPLNGKGGRVDGIELTASAPGELLTDWLAGFGAILSVSQTDSSIRVQGAAAGANSDNITLPGLSKTVWNATVYFEKYGFSARVATRYRSNYIGEITDFSGSRALEYIRHEQITDLQTSYEFQHAPLQGLSILFQVNNLTNTPFIDYAQDTRRIRDYETFGRDFFFGLNYKM
ncbi:MAG: TonB-dependent receptor [Gammaproteobacteria bacterium]|nr:TonB-dependent receptor [Gammaproteobacteria bacterium]